MELLRQTLWNDLQAHQKKLNNQRLSKLFEDNPRRFEEFSAREGELLLDYSKQHLDKQALSLLITLAAESSLKEQINALFAGKPINHTENSPALHMALREPSPKPEVRATLDQMTRWVGQLQEKRLLGCTRKPIRQLVNLGIGGSDLGPRLVCQALEPYRVNDIQIHFIANVDGDTLHALLQRLDPAETLCVITSKSFSTPETLLNAKTVKDWLQAFNVDAPSKQLLAVTANPERAREFGIDPQHIFELWGWVGGRYSLWSAAGFPIAAMLGMVGFRSLLAGAHAMDQHFLKAPFSQNLPVLLGLIGIWNINFWHCNTLAIMPYADGLQELPNYLQQLEMESNGKGVTRGGEPVEHATAPVIWGGVGCNGQHAYMQLLHQGPARIPIDFILPAAGHSAYQTQHHWLIASCLAQSQALMQGCDLESLQKDFPKGLAEAKVCPGDRPSNTLLFPKLTPDMLGRLIALYEHKVFVQGVIWDIQSFDQWGVELGKQLTGEIFPHLEGGIPAHWDSSTQGLLKYIQEHPS